jgi:hypothetical protein
MKNRRGNTRLKDIEGIEKLKRVFLRGLLCDSAFYRNYPEPILNAFKKAVSLYFI